MNLRRIHIIKKIVDDRSFMCFTTKILGFTVSDDIENLICIRDQLIAENKYYEE